MSTMVMDGGGAIMEGYATADTGRILQVKRQKSHHDLHSASRPTNYAHPAPPKSPYTLQHAQTFDSSYSTRGNPRSRPSPHSSMDRNSHNNPIPLQSDRYRPRTARSGSTSSHESLTSKVYQPPLRTKRSEPSKLRLLSQQSWNSASDGRQSLEAVSPSALVVSQQALQSSGPSSRIPESPSQLSPSFAKAYGRVDRGTAALGSPPPFSPSARDRGLSVSSSKTASTNKSSLALRPSTSIPDYHSMGSANPRHRHYQPNSSAYRPDRTPYGQSGSQSPRRREDSLAKPDGYSSDEIRASFRSALTTGSSYIGTSGTERSSILTKSSSVSDLLGIGQHHVEDKDDCFSVDDAIGLYINGFKDDSAIEDNDVDEVAANGKESTPVMKSGFPDIDQVIDPARSPSQTSNTSLPKDTATANAVYPPPDPPLNLPIRPSSPSSSHDRYGFRKASHHVTPAQYNAWSQTYEPYLARRRRKWEILLETQGISATAPKSFPAKNAKVKRFIRKGIPPDWRGAAWFFYAGGPAHIVANPGTYARLRDRAEAGEVPEIDSEAIERDLHRTFPDNIFFKPESDTPPAEPIETPILRSLRRVLQAFAIHAPKIGYCQSLNFLAGLLLLLLRESSNAEEQAFVLLDIITSHHLPGMHGVTLEGANIDLGVLMLCVRESLPAVWEMIGSDLSGPSPARPRTPRSSPLGPRLPPITLCLTPWFMTLFLSSLPIETCLRVWDVLFLEGSRTLFRISLAIFKLGEPSLRNLRTAEEMEVFQHVQNLPRAMLDANLLLASCYKRRNGFGHLSQHTVDVRREERRLIYEKERERVRESRIVLPNGLAEKGKVSSWRRLAGTTTKA